MTYSFMGTGLGGALDTLARTSGCSTAGIGPLDAQLVAEMLRLSGGKLAKITHPNVKFTSDRVHPYLSAAGHAALLRAAASGEVQINSALRTVADQFLLHAGCRGAAVPGGSSHESGRAIDVKNWPACRVALLAAGFTQPIPTNSAYFEVPGGNLRKLSVQAFQSLWNANHPEDRIAEDGVAATQTLSRIARAPSEGFPATVAGSAPTISASELVSIPATPESPALTRYDEPSQGSGGNTGLYIGLGATFAALALLGIFYVGRKPATHSSRATRTQLGSADWMVKNAKRFVGSSRRMSRHDATLTTFGNAVTRSVRAAADKWERRFGQYPETAAQVRGLRKVADLLEQGKTEKAVDAAWQLDSVVRDLLPGALLTHGGKWAR